MTVLTAIEHRRLAGDTGEQAVVWHVGLHKGSRNSAGLIEGKENILRLEGDTAVVILPDTGHLGVLSDSGLGYVAMLVEDYVYSLAKTTSGPEETHALLLTLHARILALY